MDLKPPKAFYRIGIAFSMPWIYQEVDSQTGEMQWTGYCVELIQHLSRRLNFDYELVLPQKGSFGKKDASGKWDGLVGDLMRGDTDMAVAPMVIRADREEVIDYIPPFFTQSGISIVMRKPVKETSLFKFMTVLKLEVWGSIGAVLICTALMMWFLDKYSPFSATNKPDVYNYNCREFSLKECFWFALTSFTPQGGGEPPKSLSSRVLVTSYWLFAVLMLATFTANLAAFLTVSRMQAPVQSLEQLAQQTRINYTVVNNSDIHEYFLNMKYAEDTIHRMWKELALNASIDETLYRVWDYPVREQYYSILLGINKAQPVANASEGFRIVNERLDGDFAFIHDSSEIKYEISRNCNFTEVGEVFAEKPYAIAVQQGSHLTDLLSKTVVDLTVDRVIAELHAKYWNNSARGNCDDDDSEGISLESLGGVFIGTVFGLLLGLFVMGGEVFLLKRESTKVKILSNLKENSIVKKEQIQKIVVYPDTVTIGTTFKPVFENNLTPKLSRLSIQSRGRLSQVD
ncbi:hypothetical protein ILUMI_07524 [Ignelater luminosus]|uniref:Uncharacterized protein n=1 Tax=Ignelater luminosus TaxID=2038154 RepID=A0A8K0D8N1_IGNLU|nr:hypothetical protein ILUMI_07524 [Ignelater luminosus]